MITYEQALTENEFHCIIGYNGQPVKCNGKHSNRWRRNGMTKTWKTRPGEFRVPIKFGLKYYGYIDQNNAYGFHIASECQNGEK